MCEADSCSSGNSKDGILQLRVMRSHSTEAWTTILGSYSGCKGQMALLMAPSLPLMKNCTAKVYSHCSSNLLDCICQDTVIGRHNSLAAAWSWAKIGAAEESEETSSDITDSSSEFSECKLLKAFEFAKWHNGVNDAGPVFYILPKNVFNRACEFLFYFVGEAQDHSLGKNLWWRTWNHWWQTVTTL